MDEIEKNKSNLVVLIRQCLILFVALLLLLIFFETLGGVIATCLGASGFILFTMPHKAISKTTNLVYAYLIASVIGIGFGVIYEILLFSKISWIPAALVLFRGLSVTAAVFVMVYTKRAHPPAAALALGLVSDPQRIIVAAISVGGTLVLCLIKKILSKRLHDLM